jgi:hypothetical protein
MSRVRRSRLSVTAHCSCRSPDQWRLLGALGNRHDGALGGAGIELGGRESRVSGSVIISFQCATQPTVRATAKVGVTLPARAENDAGIEIDIGIELALDEVVVGEDDALQFPRRRAPRSSAGARPWRGS